MYYLKFTCKYKEPKNDVERDMTTFREDKVESREEYDRLLAEYIEKHPEYNVVGKFMNEEEYLRDVEEHTLTYVKQVYYKDKCKGMSREEFDKLMSNTDEAVKVLRYFIMKESVCGIIRRRANLDAMPVSVYERMLGSLLDGGANAYSEVEKEIDAKYPISKK